MDQPHFNKTKETTRLEAFSDAVFAIAITLLVLELITTLHPESEEKLIPTLLHHWRSFLAFTIGFITIFICWINHHFALEPIRKVETGFMWVNAFLLFVVTITPFSTALLAQYLEEEGNIAVAFFAFNYVLISLAAFGICHYAYQHHLLAETDRASYLPYIKLYRYSIFYNLLAFLLCFISIIIPLLLYVLLFIAFAAPKKMAARINKLTQLKGH